MQVIFHSSDCVSKVLGAESYQEFRRSNIENSRGFFETIFKKSFGVFEVVTATTNSVMAVKLFCFRSII